MVDSIVNLVIDDSSGKWTSWTGGLDHAITLEPEKGRTEVQRVLREIAEKYDWKPAEEGGLSREEKRLIDAYDYALTIPVEQRRHRYQKMVTHIARQEGKVPELDDAGKEFLRNLGISLMLRPEERQARKQKSLDVARRMGIAVDKNPTPEQKAMTEEGKRRREEREQTKRNWQEIREERNAERDDSDQINR